MVYVLITKLQIQDVNSCDMEYLSNQSEPIGVTWGGKWQRNELLRMEDMLDIAIFSYHPEMLTLVDKVKDLPILQQFDGVKPDGIVVLDNIPIHHVQKIQAWVDIIKSTKTLVQFFPLYSKNLNPLR